MSITLQISDDFWIVIMHCDAIRCVICISNKVEYLVKKQLEKFYQESYIVTFRNLSNAINK